MGERRDRVEELVLELPDEKRLSQAGDEREEEPEAEIAAVLDPEGAQGDTSLE